MLPVIAIGARAVYVPYHTTWHHENEDTHDWQNNPAVRTVTGLTELAIALNDADQRDRI